MRFEGRIKKSGKFWLVEIPAFDAFTQGRTKREAFAMARDLIETMADTEGFTITAFPAISACTTGLSTMMTGPFQGLMTPTTPSGR